MTLKNTRHAVLFGGSGFVGRQLAKTLSNDGWSIDITTRRPHRHRDLLVIPSLKLKQIKQLTPKSITALINEGDTIVNLVGILNESKQSTFEDVHALLPQQIANACIEQKAHRLIHVSSLGADIEAPSAYLRTKGKGEQAVFAASNQGLDSIVIRPSVIFGRHDSFTNQFARLLKTSFGFFLVVAPDSKLQPVYVRDVVNGVSHAMNARETFCKSCDLAGPDVYSLKELIETIDQCIGRRHKMIPLNATYSKLLAKILQFAPGKPLTPDNLLSLTVPNVIDKKFPAPYGIQTGRLEEIAKNWLTPQSDRFDSYRAKAGR